MDKSPPSDNVPELTISEELPIGQNTKTEARLCHCLPSSGELYTVNRSLPDFKGNLDGTNKEGPRTTKAFLTEQANDLYSKEATNTKDK